LNFSSIGSAGGGDGAGVGVGGAGVGVGAGLAQAPSKRETINKPMTIEANQFLFFIFASFKMIPTRMAFSALFIHIVSPPFS